MASTTGVKRDFFGRVVQEHPISIGDGKETDQKGCPRNPDPSKESRGKVFVSFHEGFSNAVRKPITLDDLMRGL